MSTRKPKEKPEAAVEQTAAAGPPPASTAPDLSTVEADGPVVAGEEHDSAAGADAAPIVVAPGETATAEVVGDGTGQPLPEAVVDADGVSRQVVESGPTLIEATELAEAAQASANAAPPEEKAKLAELGTTLQPLPPCGDGGCDGAGTLARVWPHGDLQFGGRVYKAGSLVCLCPKLLTDKHVEELVRGGFVVEPKSDG